MKINQISWPLISLVVLVTGAITFGGMESFGQEVNVQPTTASPTPEVRDLRELHKYGSVQYGARQERNRGDLDKRRKISKRYDGQSWVASATPPGVASVGELTHHPPPPGFPVDESSLIAVGEVVGANAFLSNDKRGIYSELTIRVDEILKSEGKKKPKKLMVEREGGVVVYPDGQAVMYVNSQLGLPKLGSKYLFFLREGQNSNYEIVTSYNLSGGVIYQQENPRSFGEFRGETESGFIEMVRNKIRQPSNP